MWLIYALLTIISYSLFDLFLKKTSGKIDDYIATLLINTIAVVPPLLFFLFLKMSGKNMSVSREGVLFAIVSGLFVGLASIAFIKMFSSGGNLSIGSPIVRIGMVVLAAVFGVLILKETLSVRQIIGIIISVFGLSLLIFK